MEKLPSVHSLLWKQQDSNTALTGRDPVPLPIWAMLPKFAGKFPPNLPGSWGSPRPQHYYPRDRIRIQVKTISQTPLSVIAVISVDLATYLSCGSGIGKHDFAFRV
jgi:hypothetical protein